MRNAEVSFHRQERLLAENLAAEADYDAAKANFEAAGAQADQARAALSQAETNLRYTRILSPIAGVVVDRQYDVGQTVAASFQAPTLFTIAEDLGRMQVQADVDQSDIGRVQVGQTARFTVDAYPDEEFQGKISQIRLNATANQNVITYPVILEVPNPEEKLRPQMTANVTIEVAQVKDVLRVPNAALRFRPTDVKEEGRRSSGAGAGAAGRGEGGSGRQAGSASDGRRTAAAGGSGGFAAAAGQFEAAVAGGHPAKGTQTVYVLIGEDRLKPVRIRTGISDGRFTQVVGGEIAPGEEVVIGQATTRSEQTNLPMGEGCIEPRPGGDPRSRQDLPHGRGGSEGPRRRRPCHRSRGVPGDHGAVGIGEVDPDEHPRLPRPAHLRGLPPGRRRRLHPGRRRAGRDPERQDRLRLPELQPPFPHIGPGERGASAPVRPRRPLGAGARGAGARRPRSGRARRAGGSHPLPAVRGTAAAGGHRPGPHHRPGHHPGRRADGEPGLPDRRGGDGGLPGAERRGEDGDPDHPRGRHRRASPGARCTSWTGRSSRTVRRGRGHEGGADPHRGTS